MVFSPSFTRQLDFSIKGSRTGGRIGSIAGSAYGAAKGYGSPTSYDPETGKKVEKSKLRRALGAVGGAAMGKLIGHGLGSAAGFTVNTVRWDRGFRPGAPKWLQGSKNMAEAKEKLKSELAKHTNDVDRARVKKEWKSGKDLYKEAMYAAFSDEIEKIASVGALVGGYAGHRFSGKDLKSQAVGIAGGALAGHLVGEGLKATKREMIDRPAERERAELYGYVPPPPPTNFY